MKRIDVKTQRKLYWLFIPLVIVVLLEMSYLWFNVNLLDLWFGIDIDILTWCKPALIGSALIIFIGYSIAAFRQKCWEELAIALVVLIVMLLNMSNVFVDLINR
jgi:hypothetical protein